MQRIECEIIHFNRTDETEVTTARAIADRVASQTSLIVPFFADAEIRGESICSHTQLPLVYPIQTRVYVLTVLSCMGHSVTIH